MSNVNNKLLENFIYNFKEFKQTVENNKKLILPFCQYLENDYKFDESTILNTKMVFSDVSSKLIWLKEQLAVNFDKKDFSFLLFLSKLPVVIDSYQDDIKNFKQSQFRLEHNFDYIYYFACKNNNTKLIHSLLEVGYKFNKKINDLYPVEYILSSKLSVEDKKNCLFKLGLINDLNQENRGVLPVDYLFQECSSNPENFYFIDFILEKMDFEKTIISLEKTLNILQEEKFVLTGKRTHSFFNKSHFIEMFDEELSNNQESLCDFSAGSLYLIVEKQKQILAQYIEKNKLQNFSSVETMQKIKIL